MDFRLAHQKVGLNWPGRYRMTTGYRVSGFGYRETPKSDHAKWRRITGITGAVEGEVTAKVPRTPFSSAFALVVANVH